MTSVEKAITKDNASYISITIGTTPFLEWVNRPITLLSIKQEHRIIPYTPSKNYIIACSLISSTFFFMHYAYKLYRHNLILNFLLLSSLRFFAQIHDAFLACISSQSLTNVNAASSLYSQTLPISNPCDASFALYNA